MKFRRLLENLQKFDLDKYGDTEVLIQSLTNEMKVDYHIISFVGYSKTDPHCIILGDERAAEKIIRKSEFDT